MKRIEGVNWVAIKSAYQSGEGSCRELAEKFGVSHVAIRRRCTREKWLAAKLLLDSRMAPRVVQRVEQQVQSTLVREQTEHVTRKMQRIRRAEDLLDASVEQFATDLQGRPVMDVLNIKHLVQAEVQCDDVVRRALGLPDAPQKTEVETNITINVVNPFELSQQPKTLDVS